MQEDYKLKIIEGDFAGQEVALPESADTKVTIGRSPSSTMVIPSTQVSKEHAVVYFWDGKFYVRDLNSRNGTAVDGNKVQECELVPGCKLSFGDIEVVFDGPRALAAVGLGAPGVASGKALGQNKPHSGKLSNRGRDLLVGVGAVILSIVTGIMLLSYLRADEPLPTYYSVTIGEYRGNPRATVLRVPNYTRVSRVESKQSPKAKVDAVSWSAKPSSYYMLKVLPAAEGWVDVFLEGLDGREIKIRIKIFKDVSDAQDIDPLTMSRNEALTYAQDRFNDAQNNYKSAQYYYAMINCEKANAVFNSVGATPLQDKILKLLDDSKGKLSEKWGKYKRAVLESWQKFRDDTRDSTELERAQQMLDAMVTLVRPDPKDPEHQAAQIVRSIIGDRIEKIISQKKRK